jgi:hypothetical protein
VELKESTQSGHMSRYFSGIMLQPFLRRIEKTGVFLLLPLLFIGCGRFSPKPPPEYVYVSSRGTFLRDRLAAVSNRVGEVTNGQRLLALDHSRRFVKVKTDKGEIGWIDDHAVIDQKTYDQFATLNTQHAHDSVIVNGVLRDDSYLHVAPGRQTDHFYLLPENDKLQLLTRASVAKPTPPQAVPVPLPAKTASGKKPAGKGDKVAAATPPVPGMQDWWLIRDQQGRTGWIWSRMLDVEIPDEIAGLAEGQRYVGAYRLRTVNDPESKFPDGQAPEYVTVMNSWKDGMPFDFDQVRVFTWNVRKHRYETAYRQRNLQGFLPIATGMTNVNGQQEPTFSFKTASGDDIAIDPQTGAAHPAQMETENYRLEGVLVKKVEPPAPPKPVVVAPVATSASPQPVVRHRHRAVEKRKAVKHRKHK